MLHRWHFQHDLSVTEWMPSGSEVLTAWNPLPHIGWREATDKHRIHCSSMKKNLTRCWERVKFSQIFCSPFSCVIPPQAIVNPVFLLPLKTTGIFWILLSYRCLGILLWSQLTHSSTKLVAVFKELLFYFYIHLFDFKLFWLNSFSNNPRFLP